MKRILFALALLASVVASHAQGTVAFNNSFLTPVRADGTAAATGSLNVGLFYGTSQESLTLHSSLGTIGATAGVFSAPSGTLLGIPGTTGGQSVFLQVRAWTTSHGTDWLTASTTVGSVFGESAIIQVVLGPSSGPATPIWGSGAGKIAPLQAFTVVPEPSTFALGAVGIGALLMIRRRKV